MDAIEITQRQREEMRAERDAALAEVSRLRQGLDIEALPTLTIDQVNALPGCGRMWPMGLNNSIVAVIKEALKEQRRMHARAVSDIIKAGM